ncbi:MAG: glycerophosphodiester phosphodiesterase family protein [Planctomycetota bacterium]
MRAVSRRACGLLLFVLPASSQASAQLVIAHRGASHAAPENTLAAFRLALQEGADGIEGDFWLTRDRRIVCIHDENTRRTAGIARSVGDSTLAELRELDVGAWKGGSFEGERIPTLEEVLAIVPDGKKILVEIKCGPEIVPVLKQTLGGSKLKNEQIRIISFEERVISEAKKQLPAIKAYWLTGYEKNEKTGKLEPTLAEILTKLEETRADGLDCDAHPGIDASFVEALRAKGMEFHVWTVDDLVTAARFRRLGVDSITTNRPGYLLAVLPRRDLGKRLQLHLALDGSLADSSGRGRSGKALRPEALAFAQGVFGQSLDLNRRGSGIAMRCLLPDTGSISFWCYTPPWSGQQIILSSSIRPGSWTMRIHGQGQLSFRSRPKGARVTHRFHPSGDVDEWHHIALCWNRTDASDRGLRLYVNGRLSDHASWGLAAWTEPGSLVLGGGQDPKARSSRGAGRLDDFAVFDTLLSEGEVRFLMNAGVESLGVR